MKLALMTPKIRLYATTTLSLLAGVAFAACSSDSDPGGTTGGPTGDVGPTGTTGSSTSGSATTGSGTTGSAATTASGATGTTGAGTTTGAATTGGATMGGSGGGSNTTGGNTGTTGATTGTVNTTGAGGATGSGGATSSTGTGGTGGSVSVGERPCDIYAAGNTPCIAAYSMVRVLNSEYTGPLYQVRKGGGNMNTGSGGETQDVGMLPNGFADAASQDAFCGNETCTVSKLYDHSGKGNDLTVAPAGCYEGTASEPDYESNATRKAITASGNNVYGLYMNAHEGYRNNNGSGVPKGSDEQGIYEVADGTHAGSACCWDFGNASTNNCNQGTMNALFFGTGYWGKGQGSGPWFMADLEGGVWAGGTGQSSATNNNLPSSPMEFAFGILKTGPSNYAIRVGDATQGSLTTAYDGGLPKNLSHPGGIILGIGGDNSNSSFGTFFEGAMTAGRPSDETEDAVLQNVQAAGYGK